MHIPQDYTVSSLWNTAYTKMEGEKSYMIIACSLHENRGSFKAKCLYYWIENACVEYSSSVTNTSFHTLRYQIM